MMGESVILLASARLRTYLPWTSAVLIRPSANRGWHGSNFSRNSSCRGIHLDVAVPGDRFDRILKDREQDRQNIVIIVFWKTIRHVNLELKLFPNSIAVNIGGRFQRM